MAAVAKGTLSKSPAGIRIPGLVGNPHPPAPYLSLSASIDKLVDFLRRGKGKTLILTGAGVSVDSGIRAYRGKHGSYTVNKKHRPIFFQEFVNSEPHRRRYWARSYLGYPPVRLSAPNPTHYAIAGLQKMKLCPTLITQNVDGLHHKAWDTDLSTYLSPASVKPTATTSPSLPTATSAQILELHGTLRHAHCLSCGTPVGRDAFQDKLSDLNPEWAKYIDEVDDGREERLNPDGDVELGPGIHYEDFEVPPCDNCGGPMKPKVTFFGESLEPAVREQSTKWVSDASQLLVVGSSLATFSAYRLIRQKKDEKGEVGLLNVGESRGDPVVDWRIGWEGGASDIFPAAVEKLLKDEQDPVIIAEVKRMLQSGVVKRVSGGRSTS